MAAKCGTPGRVASPPFSRHTTEGEAIVARAAYQARTDLEMLRKGDDGEVVHSMQRYRRNERTAPNPEPTKRDPKRQAHQECNSGNARRVGNGSAANREGMSECEDDR